VEYDGSRMFGGGLRDAEQHHLEFSELHGAGSSAESGDGDGQGHERGRREQVQLSKHHDYWRTSGDQCFCVTQFRFAICGEQPGVNGDDDE
jgi:hypothetical protein